MYFTQISIIVASLAALALAVPTPSSCSIAYPAVARVSEAQPVESYLPGFRISQGPGATNRNDMFAEFNIPAGSWGCTLQYYFPAGTPVTTSGSAPVEAFSVAGPLSRSPRGIDISWDYCPAPISQVGHFQFKSSPSQPTTKVINSFACADVMTYRFSIADGYTGATSVRFNQNSYAGLRMTYNC